MVWTGVGILCYQKKPCQHVESKVCCLLVEKRIQDCGVYLASECDRCVQPAEETIDHIQCKCEIARCIWDLVANSLNVNCI